MSSILGKVEFETSSLNYSSLSIPKTWGSLPLDWGLCLRFLSPPPTRNHDFRTSTVVKLLFTIIHLLWWYRIFRKLFYLLKSSEGSPSYWAPFICRVGRLTIITARGEMDFKKICHSHEEDLPYWIV